MPDDGLSSDATSTVWCAAMATDGGPHRRQSGRDADDQGNIRFGTTDSAGSKSLTRLS